MEGKNKSIEELIEQVIGAIILIVLVVAWFGRSDDNRSSNSMVPTSTSAIETEKEVTKQNYVANNQQRTNQQTKTNTDDEKTLSGEVSISDISKLNVQEKLIAECSYSLLLSVSPSIKSEKATVKTVEVLEKDNYGRYLTQFVVNAPFNSNYNMDYRYWIIIWNVKEDGTYNYNLFRSFFTNENNTLDSAKKQAKWGEPLE